MSGFVPMNAGERVPAYSAAGEMITSGGSATIGSQQVHFAHQIRYWMVLGNPIGGPAAATSSPVRVVRIGDEFFIDYLVL